VLIFTDIRKSQRFLLAIGTASFLSDDGRFLK